MGALTLKPLFMWAGGKNKMLKHYKPLMPASVISYCEPFFGGGAMFIYVMNTYSPEYACINDINPDIVRIYTSIKTDLEAFLTRLNALESKYLPLSKEDRKKYYYVVRNEHAYDYKTWNKPYEAATLYFLMKTGFNGIFQINKNTNNRYGTPSGLLNQKDAAENCPEDTFFFFDPPYRDSFANYNNAFSDDSLRELIQFCDNQSNVMLSNRDDDDWFQNECRTLNYIHFDIFYTAGRRKKTEEGYNAKKAREILLYNTIKEITLEAHLG